MTELAVLLQPYQLNSKLELANRIVMAPMTRNMAQDDFTPTADMAAYYARRADAGLIITEGTVIRPDGRGYSNTPGIYTDQHIAGWRAVTKAVHQQGGKIFNQIWHVGRVSHPHFLKGELPISASATLMTSEVKRSPGLKHGPARAVSRNEVSQLATDFGRAAQNAQHAGFDGIEIHAANGYLIDQFLHQATNLRQDEYGGSPANKARFALEVVHACGKAIGYERVGIRLSPGAYLHEIVGQPEDYATFRYLLEQLSSLKIAYVHVGNFDDSVVFKELQNLTMTQFCRRFYRGQLIACGNYTMPAAAKAITDHKFDLIALGRPFIANPDLMTKLKQGLELAPYSPDLLNTLR